MALGRGLGELLGEVEVAYENNNEISSDNIKEIDVDNIKTNPYQPRKSFDHDKLKELSNSIVKNGLLQPIVVTRDGENYLLIAGERRLRATKLANISTIKAIILDVEDSKLRELALIENIQRDDLNIMEIADSYAGLMNDYGITQDELSKIVSKSRSSIANIVRLLTLSDYAKDMLIKNQITLGHAKLIVGLTQDQQKLVIDSIVGQKLSVRETELLVKNIKNKDKNEELITKKDIKKSYNLSSFSTITQKLKDDNLEVKVDQNYFKIKINSQEDIEKITKYFQN